MDRVVKPTTKQKPSGSIITAKDKNKGKQSDYDVLRAKANM